MDIKKLKIDIWGEGWMGGWIYRDSSILQLEFTFLQRDLGGKQIKPDAMGNQDAVVGLQSHKSSMW